MCGKIKIPISGLRIALPTITKESIRNARVLPAPSVRSASSNGSLKALRVLPSLTQLNRAVVDCTLCPRLVAYREEIGRVKRRAYKDWEYWAKPVPGFGDREARVL